MIDLDTLRKVKGYLLAIVDESTGEYKPVSSDIVQVIRCNDCKWCAEYYDVNLSAPYWVCDNWGGQTDADGYCHEAERKEE